MTVPVLTAADVLRVPPREAVAAIEGALRSGFDPAADPPRAVLPTEHGQLLLMPSEAGTLAGVKIATVAPGNALRGLPRVHAVYVVFDAETLQPKAILDGTALTTLRTPAVSIAAVRPALQQREPVRVVVFGSGPQALGHVATLRDVVTVAEVTYAARTPRSVDGIDAVLVGSAALDDALGAADVVVCATTAREPLFDSALLGDRTVVIAVGSHDPDAREVDAAFCGRAVVVVEDVATALRESGEAVQAIAEGALTVEGLVALRDVVGGAVELPSDRAVLFSSSGMAWEDLAVAGAVLAAAGV